MLVQDKWLVQWSIKRHFYEKKILPQEGFRSDQPAGRSPLHGAPAAALLIRSTRVPSLGTDVVTGEAAVSPNCWCPLIRCGVSGWSPIRGLTQVFPGKHPGTAEQRKSQAGSLQTPPRRGAPGAEPRETRTTPWDGSHILCLEGHHGNVPRGPGMAPSVLPSQALSRKGACSAGLVNTSLPAEVVVVRDPHGRGIAEPAVRERSAEPIPTRRG